MPALPDNLTETPHKHAGGSHMDALSDILSSLHLSGGVVVDAHVAGDWCMISEFTAEHCAKYFPVPGTLIAYHYVRSGELWAKVDGHAPIHARQGSVLVFPRNDRHLLYSRSGLEPVDADDLLKPGVDGSPATIRIDGDGPVTELFCGFLGVSGQTHPLIESLPAVLLLEGDDATRDWVASSMRFLSDQSPEMVAQIAEAFVSHAIGRHLETSARDAEGWIGGLKDPAVTRALSIIHRRFAEDLDIEGLAREAGVSRSVLGERFTTFIGEPPMRYCTRVRMRVAADLLRRGESTAKAGYAVGFQSESAFNRAFKREYGEPPATWRRRVAAEAAMPELPEQVVLHCTAHDGTRLAYSAIGEGPPLVKTANWLNHLEFDFESPIWSGWLRALAADFRLIRYDERGNGLSDWDTPELSLDAFVDDLACVVDAAGVDRFDLLGISQGAAVAIAYSLKYPERVRRMVLLGGYAAGWRTRADNEEIARREAMLTLTELGWGKDSPAYRQLFTSFYVPGANPEQMSWFNELQRRSASPNNAVELMRVFSAIDVRGLLPLVRHPTLVLHARGDQAIPFEEGEKLARGIADARFVPLESSNHILLDKEPAFRRFVEELKRFLGEDDHLPHDFVRDGSARALTERF
jgi:pimeloyl-ACP methyl ester carboxylesterase/AraC-like DNA-binding protein